MRSVFIFPSRFGWLFIVLCMCLFLLGTNYQNNLMLLLCFLLVGLLLINLHASYWNFVRLNLKLNAISPGYAGDHAILRLDSNASKRTKTAHGLIYVSSFNNQERHSIDCDTDTTGEISMQLPTRGIYRVPRLTIESYYPLGIYRCWTHLDFDRHIFVYPKPVPCPVKLYNQASDNDEGSGLQESAGTEDFDGLKSYVVGDSLHRVAWKQVAKQQQWLSKQFSSNTAVVGWLKLSVVDSDAVELALSQLAFQINQCSQKNVCFGLQLGNYSIAPSQGDAHRTDCLKALACYPNRPENIA
ncbi:DUF58 domain-containing protein [Alteromonas facilis]|uniref:DUF58 domain-containing protein n=1 Tax=Alteromonas facilis TaxID=2048004 RepID=UPI000C294362|nr:DUF58 domain-containing protein [Alteromonas facilis]